MSDYIKYIVKVIYIENDNEVRLYLFNHRSNAMDFIINLIEDTEGLGSDEIDAADIAAILDDTNAYVDDVNSVSYEIVPVKYQD